MSGNMKSACISAFTESILDIRIEETAVPQPGPGQVRVRMLMSPVNPSDLNFLHGTYHQALKRIIWNQGEGHKPTVFFDPAHQLPCPTPPYALGGEGLGIVDAAGSGLLARRLRGKRVAIAGGPPNGTWQEYTVVDAKRAIALPPSIPDEQGAMFFINPVTAYVMVREILRVPRDSWLLITAAGSALGKSVVRMGRLYGFKTLCVVRSDSNTAELERLGADAVVATERQDLHGEVFRLTGGQGVSYAIDCVGGELSAQVVRCLGLAGHLVLYGTLANRPLQLAIRDLMMPMATISGFLLPNWISQQSPLKLLSVMGQVKRLTRDGLFTTEVSSVYPLDQVARAVTAALQPGRTGKVMLRIGDS